MLNLNKPNSQAYIQILKNKHIYKQKTNNQQTMAKKEKKERERYLPSVEDKDLPSVEDEIRDSNLSIRAFY